MTARIGEEAAHFETAVLNWNYGYIGNSVSWMRKSLNKTSEDSSNFSSSRGNWFPALHRPITWLGSGFSVAPMDGCSSFHFLFFSRSSSDLNFSQGSWSSRRGVNQT